MADSTTTDVAKVNATEPRKELKSYSEDKAELTAWLQAVISQDHHADINLDSNEIDFEALLEDEYKNQTDSLEKAAVEPLHLALALVDQQTSVPSQVDAKPQRTLKRKTDNAVKDQINDSNQDQLNEPGVKKNVLNRALSVTATSQSLATAEKAVDSNISSEKEQHRITADIDPKKKIELRAKRFGLPLKMSEIERKEARKIRFGQICAVRNMTTNGNNFYLAENLKKIKYRAEEPVDFNMSSKKEQNRITEMEMRAKRFGLPLKMSEAERKEARKIRFGQKGTGRNMNNSNKLYLAEDIEKLRKRAERFGQSVSTIMTKIENTERLAKRKAKFGECTKLSS